MSMVFFLHVRHAALVTPQAAGLNRRWSLCQHTTIGPRCDNVSVVNLHWMYLKHVCFLFPNVRKTKGNLLIDLVEHFIT